MTYPDRALHDSSLNKHDLLKQLLPLEYAKLIISNIDKERTQDSDDETDSGDDESPTVNDRIENDYQLASHVQQFEYTYAALCIAFSELLKNEQVSTDLLKLVLATMQELSEKLEMITGQLLSSDDQSKKWREESDKISDLLDELDTVDILYNDANELPVTVSRFTRAFRFIGSILLTPFNPLIDFFKSLRRAPVTTIKNFLRDSNWWRLFIVRAKGAIHSLSNLEPLNSPLQFLNNALSRANIVFSYLSMYYLFRLSIDLAIILKHVLAIRIAARERALGAWKRSLLQAKLLWSEVTNDGVWAALAIAVVFFISGSLATNLIIGFYVFDIALASISAFVKYRKHDVLINGLQKNMDNLQREIDQHKASPFSSSKGLEKLTTRMNLLVTYREALFQQIRFERRQLAISVVITVALFFSVVGGVSFLAATGPILPVLCSSLLLITCISHYFISKHMEKNAPIKTVNVANLKLAIKNSRCRNILSGLEQSTAAVKQRLLQKTKPINETPRSLNESTNTLQAVNFIEGPTLSREEEVDSNQNAVATPPLRNIRLSGLFAVNTPVTAHSTPSVRRNYSVQCFE